MAVNYLNNRDLLKELHKSKNTFCSYAALEYSNYDIILPSIDKINIRSIAQAKRNRAERLARENWEKASVEGVKLKLSQFAIDPKTILKTDVIFRITTFEHIPLAPGRKKTPKSVADNHFKINFPPFQHFKFNDDNELICVGKSHWSGGLSNGQFSIEHGKMTNKIGKMFLTLCERYARRGNWRGYTYNDEMIGRAILHLMQIGLQFDESKSLNPFAYFTQSIKNSFTRVLNDEKRSQNIRDDILEMNGLNPSYTRMGQVD